MIGRNGRNGRNGRALRKENTTFFYIQIKIQSPLISNLSIYILLLSTIDMSCDYNLQYDWSCHYVRGGGIFVRYFHFP